MSPFRVFLFVLGLAAAGGALAAWEALTGPLPVLALLHGDAPPKLAARAPAHDPSPEPDVAAQVRALVETVAHLGDEVAQVRGMADTAANKAAAVERRHEALDAEFWRLAGEVAAKSRNATTREPRATVKGRRTPPPVSACPPEK